MTILYVLIPLFVIFVAIYLILEKERNDEHKQ